MFGVGGRRGVLALAVGTLIVVGVPLLPAVAEDAALVFDRVGDPDDDLGKWARTGDVLRFRVRLEGIGRDASLAVAASPVQALSTVECAPEAGPLPSEPILSSPVQEITPSAAPSVARAASGVRVCQLGDVSGERAVDVRLTVPQGAKEVVLAAVAQLRGEIGVRTLRKSATTPVVARVMDLPAAAAQGSQFAISGTAKPLDQLEARPPKSRHRSGNRHPMHAQLPEPLRVPGQPPGQVLGAGPMLGRSGVAPRQAELGPIPAQVAPIPAQAGAVPSQGSQPVLPRVADDELVVPLPRQLAMANDQPARSESFNLVTGGGGLPVVAFGIAVLLGGLWAVVRAQRARIRRKVL